MTVEQRFQAGFEEEATDEPGLVLDDDGTVWVVAPGGTRTRVSGGGGGLPDQWTVDPDSGALTILASPTDGFPLDVRGHDVGANGAFFFSLNPDDEDYTFYMLGDGSLFLTCDTPGQGQQLNIVDTSDDGQVILSTRNGVQIEPTGGGGNFFFGLAVRPHAAPEVVTARFQAAAGQTVPVFDVIDASLGTAFQIDADGTVHIKTGSSIVADL